jgi:hypothetical protein
VRALRGEAVMASDPLAPARGIIIGLIISVVLWVVIVSAYGVLVR